MRSVSLSRPLAFAGGLPGDAAWVLLGAALRPLRRLTGGSLLAVMAAGAWWTLPIGEATGSGIARAAASAPTAAASAGAESPRELARVVPQALREAVRLPAPPPAPAVVEPAPGHGLAGQASYYASKFEGRRTASGERYRGRSLTAAHRTLPFGTRVRVTSERTGRSVVVRINDRGPFHPRRVIDLSHSAASRLGMLRRGRDTVRLEVLGRT